MVDCEPMSRRVRPPSSSPWPTRSRCGARFEQPMYVVRQGGARRFPLGGILRVCRFEARLDVPPGCSDPNIVPLPRSRHRQDARNRRARAAGRARAVLIAVADDPGRPSCCRPPGGPQRSCRPVRLPRRQIDAIGSSPFDAAPREAEEEVGPSRDSSSRSALSISLAPRSASVPAERSPGAVGLSSARSTIPRLITRSKCRYPS